MKLHELTYTKGARKSAKRLGRGIGSGTGKTAGKGEKGQKARSGGGTRLGFEGGQMPLYRRIPKRGFTNMNTVKYAVVNLEELNAFEDGSVVTPTLLVEKGIVKKELGGVKILARGELSKKLTVKAHKFSQKASEAIVKLGGKAEVI